MQILGVLMLVTIGGITIIALLTALALIIPAPIEKTRQNLENTLGRSLLLGVVNFIFFMVLVVAFIWLSQNVLQFIAGIFIFLAVVILLGLVIFTLIGLTAFVTMLGERLGEGKTPITSNLRGGLLIILAGLAPYVGWFVFTPLVLWTGLGAAISALVRRRKKTTSVEDTA
jgi:hypothetical protein